MAKHLAGAVATLVGTVIGAGVLGLPYVIAQSGLLIGILHIIFIGLAVMLLNLYVGEISLRTKGKHQLTGFAQKYLGKHGKIIMLLSMMVSIYGALTAYLIGEGASFSSLLNIDSTYAMLIFFIVLSYLIYRGLNIIEGAEVWLNIFRGLVFLIILFIAVFNIKIENLLYVKPANMLAPYGVVFFAFLGTAAIPELEAELAHNKKLLKKAILLGMLIPMAVYVLFAIATVGSMGVSTTEIATIGLSGFGKLALITGNLFAIISMATAFLTLGLALEWVYRFDYKIKKPLSWIMTCIPPLLIAMIEMPSFVKVLGVSGAVSGGLQAILIVLMHSKAKQFGDVKPAYSFKSRWYLKFLLITLSVAGIMYTLLNI